MHDQNTRPTPDYVLATATGIAILSLVVAALAAAKITGIVTMSWWLLTSPLWLTALGAWMLFAAAFLGAMLIEAARRVQQ
jgi:hypothetical protein